MRRMRPRGWRSAVLGCRAVRSRGEREARHTECSCHGENGAGNSHGFLLQVDVRGKQHASAARRKRFKTACSRVDARTELCRSYIADQVNKRTIVTDRIGSLMNYEDFMEAALGEARRAGEAGEVPIG